MREREVTTNRTVDDRVRRKMWRCDRCPANRGENLNRTPYRSWKQRRETKYK